MNRECVSGLDAVITAAKLCESVQVETATGRQTGKLDKDDGSPVTVADFGSQAVICRLITESFPKDVILAEENSAVLHESQNSKMLSAITRFVREQITSTAQESVCKWIDMGQGNPGSRYWMLDPIDGTKGFLRHEQYAIALALIEGGMVQCGFLACPAFSYRGRKGVVFVAQRNRGTQAFGLDKVTLGAVSVSEVNDVQCARLVESVETAHRNEGVSRMLQKTLGIKGKVVGMDSQAKYAAVATGQAEMYLRFPNARTPDYREKAWDHAAGFLVVKEAGGKVSDAYGKCLDWTHGRELEANTGIVATNSYLHEEVIKSLSGLI